MIHVDPEAIEDLRDKINATREANEERPIDFGQPVDPATLGRRKRKDDSLWVRKLKQVADAFERGELEIGMVYLIGEFGSKQGAAAALRTLENNVEKIPDLGEEWEFDVQARADGQGGSRLWAGVARVGMFDARNGVPSDADDDQWTVDDEDARDDEVARDDGDAREWRIQEEELDEDGNPVEPYEYTGPSYMSPEEEREHEMQGRYYTPPKHT